MLEIERKFLVDTERWKPASKGVRIVQGYLSTDKKRVVRVRIKGEQAFLTIKGENLGLSRLELEYPIPLEHARELMKIVVNPPIDKIRYTEEHGGMIWEIDVFEGTNMGLVMAEVELQDEQQKIEIPDWAIKEVSDDPRYHNSWLSAHPFQEWDNGY